MIAGVLFPAGAAPCGRLCQRLADVPACEKINSQNVKIGVDKLDTVCYTMTIDSSPQVTDAAGHPEGRAEVRPNIPDETPRYEKCNHDSFP